MAKAAASKATVTAARAPRQGGNLTGGARAALTRTDYQELRDLRVDREKHGEAVLLGRRLRSGRNPGGGDAGAGAGAAQGSCLMGRTQHQHMDTTSKKRKNRNRQTPADGLTKAERKVRRKQEQQHKEAQQQQEKAQQHETWIAWCEAISSEVTKLRVIRATQLRAWHSQDTHPLYTDDKYTAAGVFSLPTTRRVLLHGLTSRALNGREGFIKSESDPFTQRMLVGLCSRGTDTVERTISVKATNVNEPRAALLAILERLDSFAGQLCWHVCKFFRRLMPQADVWWLARPNGVRCAWRVRARFRNGCASDSAGEISDSAGESSDNESDPGPVVARAIRWKTPDNTCIYEIKSLTSQVSYVPRRHTNLNRFLSANPQIRDVMVIGPVPELISGPIRKLELDWEAGDGCYALDAPGLAAELESLVVYSRGCVMMAGLHSGVQFARLVHIDLQPACVAFDDCDMTGEIEEVRQLIAVTPALRVLRINAPVCGCRHGSISWRPHSDCSCHESAASLSIRIWQPLEVLHLSGGCWQLSAATCDSIQQLHFSNGIIDLTNQRATNQWNLSLARPMSVLGRLTLSNVTLPDTPHSPHLAFPCARNLEMKDMQFQDAVNLLFCFDFRIARFAEITLWPPSSGSRSRCAMREVPKGLHAAQSCALRETLQACMPYGAWPAGSKCKVACECDRHRAANKWSKCQACSGSVQWARDDNCRLVPLRAYPLSTLYTDRLLIPLCQTIAMNVD